MPRLEEFPLPENILPAKLKALLEPVTSEQSHLKVDVATSFEKDIHGPDREAVHMLVLAVPAEEAENVPVLSQGSTGVVDSPVGMVDEKGGLRIFQPSASGFDPIVMSWGTGSYFAFNLSEKVWMSLGLSPRCFGNLNQTIVYDDPTAPEFSVAGGEISRAYYFTASRDLSWTMRNDYLRKYLWMRNAEGIRSFFYEGLLKETPELRAIMNGKTHYRDEEAGNWYVLDIREWQGKLLLQVWATVLAISPKLCPEPDIHTLIWPGDNEPVTEERASQAAMCTKSFYLKDTFLEQYEQNSIYDTIPVRTPDNIWYCSPSYGGQWSFVNCRRIARNLIIVEVYDLYKKAIPTREILHAHAHAIAPEEAAALPGDEEHIPAKTHRFVCQLLDLGDNLSTLCGAIGLVRTPAVEVVALCRDEIKNNGWCEYPRLCRLAQVAPLDMTQQAFLSRCKTLHEILQRIPNAVLKSLLRTAGCAKVDLKGLGSNKMFQGLSNILDELHTSQDDVSAFAGAAKAIDWRAKSVAVAPLFVTNDLRIADAHEGAGDWVLQLEELGFDTAQINDGYGRALDFVLDRVIDTLYSLNEKLSALLQR